MAINFEAPMTWKEFKSLEKEEQHDYLQHLIDTYNANAVSFAQMFRNNANTVRKYIADNDIGITLSRGNRVDRARWNEFLGIHETEEEAAAASEPEPQPKPTVSGMQVCSATMRLCGAIDVEAIAAELKRIFDGNTLGEIEISFTVKEV